MVKYSKILIIGDSLSDFSRDTVSYFNFLSNIGHLNGYEFIPFVYPFSGMTSAYIVREGIKLLREYDDVKEVFFQAGTNDAKFHIPKEEFRNNVELFVRTAKIYNFRTYLMKIPLFYGGLGTDGYTKEMVEFIKSYNEELQKMDGYLISVDFDKDDFADGVHFNKSGNYKVAKAIFDKIREVREFD